jgi:dienelactone hydrolase
MRSLGHAFRSIGFATLVPTFPEASRLEISPNILDQMTKAALWMLAQPEVDPTRAGIFGASFGGSVAYIVSASPSLFGRFNWVGSFGAYASLRNVLEYGLRGVYPPDGKPFPVPPDPYVRDILAAQPDARQYGEILSIGSKILFSKRTKMLVCHSEADAVVPFEEMNALARIFDKQGIPFKTYLIRSAPHARVSRWWTNRSFIYAAKAIVRVGLRRGDKV